MLVFDFRCFKQVSLDANLLSLKNLASRTFLHNPKHSKQISSGRSDKLKYIYRSFLRFITLQNDL